MKTFKRICYSFAVILMSTPLMAAANPGIVLAPVGKSVHFQMEEVTGETRIDFTDKAGKLLYSEKLVDVKHYARKFDMKNLEEGSYFVKVEDVSRLKTYTLLLKDGSLRISTIEEKVKPFFWKKGKKLYVNLLNLDSEEVEIKVIDSNNRILFVERIDRTQVVEKAINFEKAYSDMYTVIVTVKEDTFSENVVID
ncbi:hypothetical protein [Zeaxanthinibacter enoshimensis]|uniref:Secreted protein (Por secretion system target) n=1 Tax=Zeaxanthinibacter enoshimensis TaxID=392009 RepID=A0A4R6TJ11_9FLAO|nr:hypothetical protein [Zeaxanthinibacter enoshimensis]TDQ30844.1 hypothetical protein CLV82_1540 [Zeaxanthinibacter enoshimensis]